MLFLVRLSNFLLFDTYSCKYRKALIRSDDDIVEVCNNVIAAGNDVIPFIIPVLDF
jgi:hypothetical protein